MSWTTIKKLEDIQIQISQLRTALKEQKLLMNLPKNFPNHIHLLDTQKEIWLYAHNILGWVLGIVLDKKTKTMKQINTNKARYNKGNN